MRFVFNRWLQNNVLRVTAKNNALVRNLGTENIRNVAIIAHVDHGIILFGKFGFNNVGKTSLVDCLLRQSGTVDILNKEVRLMDSNILEKERGITILAKYTSLRWKQYDINIVDTPGHADFGGEVERALMMVDGVILVVDSTEGPMAQTKVVLDKALRRSLIPLVVQNKVDRDSARCDEVDCEILDLFMSLNATEKQLDFPTFYASAREGWAFTQNPFSTKYEYKKGSQIVGDMSRIFDAIISQVPHPKTKIDKPFSLLVNAIDFNPYVGKCVLGKVESGSARLGDPIKSLSPDGVISEQNRITRIFVRRGLNVMDISSAFAGQIVSIAGIQNARVNYTIGAPEIPNALEIFPIDPPTISMTFLVNNSPLAGHEGKTLTKISLMERLQFECENNPSLKFESCSDLPDGFKVSGRGEMQLAILIETMRREGLEFAVSQPQVVFIKDMKGNEIKEPIEEVTIDCETEFSGSVIEKMLKRKGEILKMTETIDGRSRLKFKCPMRGLIGYFTELKNDTKGTGLLNHVFFGYEPYKGFIQLSRKGSLISMSDGIATGYALSELESRGELFITPGTKVYPGMVIGESSRSFEMEVNPCRAKILTNIRSSVKEEFFRLRPAKMMSLEEMISYMVEDEILEITPKNFRLRKRDLDPNARKRRAQSKNAVSHN